MIFRSGLLPERKTAHILCAAPRLRGGRLFGSSDWDREGRNGVVGQEHSLRSSPHPNPLPQAGEGMHTALLVLAPLPLAGEGLG
ncbi:hypothetical protein DX914_07925 [Lysobacter silvisoli]|uniref:Uncharacterized protein n=1 Tax=Lysobacter silvisoli TaxID=2293254 RepID=A0A371K513_9GAMM|nr:hypothetical protein DX914_07925 [Lysobacter silvisoli]